MKLSKVTDKLEIFKLNQELGQLLDCRLDLFNIPYIEFTNGEYDEDVLRRIEDMQGDQLFTEGEEDDEEL